MLGLTTAELDLVRAAQLSLGGVTTTADIALGQSGDAGIDLGTHGGFGVLTFQTSGAVTQAAPLAVSDVAGTAGSVTLDNTGNSISQLSGLTASGTNTVTSSGDLLITGANSGTAVNLTAGGSLTVAGVASGTGTGTAVSLQAGVTLSVTGTASSQGDLSLVSGDGGIALGGTVSAPGNQLYINSAGPVLQTAGTVVADNLYGSTGSVSLPSPSNAIAGIATRNASLTVTGASVDFLLADSVALTVGSSPGGGLSVPTGRSITLATNALTINSPGNGNYGSGGAEWHDRPDPV